LESKVRRARRSITMVHKNRFVVQCVFDTWAERRELSEILSALGGGNIRIETEAEWKERQEKAERALHKESKVRRANR
jgi:hypothetical protein